MMEEPEATAINFTESRLKKVHLLLTEDYKTGFKEGVEKYIEAMTLVKPTLGLRPKRFVDEQRLHEVCGAISRRYNANQIIPVEWVTEYNDLIETLSKP